MASRPWAPSASRTPTRSRCGAGRPRKPASARIGDLRRTRAGWRSAATTSSSGGGSGAPSATRTGSRSGAAHDGSVADVSGGARSGQVDVISAFSTDGRIAAFDLLVLEDERGAIPPYDAVVLAGPRLVRERPDVLAALRRLAGTIDAARCAGMNLAVDQDGASPAAVGRRAFLQELRRGTAQPSPRNQPRRHEDLAVSELADEQMQPRRHERHEEDRGIRLSARSDPH